MELHPLIEKTLLKMNFLEKYLSLVKSFSVRNESKEFFPANMDVDRVQDIATRSGTTLKFVKREHFYKTGNVDIQGYAVRLHLIIESGMVDAIWVVMSNGVCIAGMPLCVYPSYLSDWQGHPPRPFFSSYEDLEKIVPMQISLFHDFLVAFQDCVSE